MKKGLLRRWRLILVVGGAMCLLALAGGAFMLSRTGFLLWRPYESWVDIGEFPSRDAAMRAAIKRLAIETQNYPNKELYRVVWVGPYSDENEVYRENPDRHALLYVQRQGENYLGFEPDVFSGTENRTYYVDRADIKAVAEKGGTLEDFDHYDRNRPQVR